MSKPSQIDSAKIRNKAELIAWFEAGCTPARKLLIGVEHEKPPFYLDNNDPVPYQGCENRAGIKEFFEKMAREDNWRPGYELANIIALQKDKVSWTLEPGGQMETGGAPLKDVHQIARETDDTIQEAVKVAKSLGIGLLALGYHPTHSGKDMPFMPKSRNRTFREYVEQKKFAHGLDGMFCTSTVQVNLNYESEADMV